MRNSPENSDGQSSNAWNGRPPESRGPLNLRMEKIFAEMQDYREMFSQFGCELYFRQYWIKGSDPAQEDYRWEIGFGFNPEDGWDEFDPTDFAFDEIKEEILAICKMVEEGLSLQHRSRELVTALLHPSITYFTYDGSVRAEVRLLSQETSAELRHPEVYYPN